MQAIIDPRSKFVYVSYYYYGLQLVFDSKNVVFDSEPFMDLLLGDKDIGFDHLVAIIILPAKKRIVIDFGDKHRINKNGLHWCDVYAKINIRAGHTFADLSGKEVLKIEQIGPGFGINQLSTTRLGCLAISNRLKIKSLVDRVAVSEKQFFGGYNWARKRLSLESYSDSSTYANDDYIFHVSQYYMNQSGGGEANNARLKFVQCAAKHCNVRFEGGLVSPANAVNGQDRSMYASTQYSMEEYLRNTKNSAVVFNTPAAWGCHGWKLGEYLAMGKAIISMPLVNEVPPGLVHGENIHLVEDSENLSEVINHILFDHDYRRHLEVNAFKYFQQCLHPEKIIRKLVEGLL